jgi:hypothetical protein
VRFASPTAKPTAISAAPISPWYLSGEPILFVYVFGMSVDTMAIWNHLGVEADEIAALSAIYTTSDGVLTLAAASLVVGPEAIADGWPAWRAGEGFKPAPSEDALLIPGEFVASPIDGVVVGRAVLDPQAAYRWLRILLETGDAGKAGPLPAAKASIHVARAPIRICSHSETEAGDLATWLARPMTGFHFKQAAAVPGIEPGKSWTIGDIQLFSPAVDILGMSWFEDKNGAPPAGLVVGRFERRAWLATQRLDQENDLYRVEVGLEPERVELMDLEIEVEESIGDELVFAEHLRLEDTDLGQTQKILYGPRPTNGRRLEVGVALPTLGRGVKRSVRLVHRDGVLLDEWQSFNIVESISVSLAVNGAQQKPNTIGETRGAQDLVELLGAVERVRKQYADLRRGGARNRVFEDPGDGRDALRALLERAPGELLVVDPYFKDWPLLTGFPGPHPRVLIGKGAQDPPAAFEGKVARWKKSLPPFHDRFFLWEGGGASVGTSAGSLTERLFRIVRIGTAESEVLRERFSLWWDDPGFERL